MPDGMYVPGMTAPPDLSLMVLAAYLAAGLVAVIAGLTLLGVFTLPIFFLTLFGVELLLRGLQNTGWFGVKMVLLMFRSLRRNMLRTALTYVALFVFTGVLTLIYSIVSFLGKVTEEKETDVKVIMTEKFQIPSQMPPGYAAQLQAIIQTDLPPESRPKNMRDDFMTWSFMFGSTDPNVRSLQTMFGAFAMDPHVLTTGMMDGLSADDVGADGRRQLEEGVAAVQADKRNVIVGKDVLARLNKKVGDEFKVYGLMYKDVEFEFKIVAEFPDSRYNQSAVMRADYLMSKLDEYKQKKGQPHPLADRCLNLIWVRLPDKRAYEQLAAVVNQPGKFSAPAVKLETASAGIGSFLDAFKDIFWACKWILMPALAVIMALVVSITMTIAIRERWTEMAVLKVLGFRPNHVFLMVLGEGLLIGLLGGGICTNIIYWSLANGIKFPVAFFNTFYPPWQIVVYGPLLGMAAAFVGTFPPAWAARGVKASEVFSQVA